MKVALGIYLGFILLTSAIICGAIVTSQNIVIHSHEMSPEGPTRGVNLADLMQPKPEYVKVVDENGTPAIYLASVIGGQDDYKELIIWINSLDSTKVPRVKVYLSGNGGDVRGVIDLINTIQASKTKFDMIVYGDVYSAHATLAVNGDTLTVTKPSTLFLFHEAAVETNDGNNVTTSKACEVFLKGKTDRGIDAVLKCQLMQKALQKEWDTGVMANVYNLLTPLQLKQLQNGYDIMIPWSELQHRYLMKTKTYKKDNGVVNAA